ncbi:hypothetical protein ACVU7I_09930 [Patulibacter sp. S7RM1-6]
MIRSTTVAGTALALVFAVTGSAVAGGAGSGSSKSGYTIKVSNSGAGGDPGYFYEGGPLNITVKKLRGKSNAKVTVQITPHATDRKGPFHSRVGKVITGLAPSKVGTAKITVKVDSLSKTLRRTIRVRAAG